MTTVGSGTYSYEVIDNWAKLPEGWTFGILVGVAVDSNDRVYVCHQRNDPPILVANTKRLTEEVGWTPKFNINTGLDHTIQWWKSVL